MFGNFMTVFHPDNFSANFRTQPVCYGMCCETNPTEVVVAVLDSTCGVFLIWILKAQIIFTIIGRDTSTGTNLMKNEKDGNQ